MNLKHIIYRGFILGFIIIPLTTLSLTSCQKPILKDAKNIVLMIGDGMGFHHLDLAEVYNGQPTLFMTREALALGELTTRSANSENTDSAAAATALATGHKVNNGEIAYHNNAQLASLSDIAILINKGVGIIASEPVYGATPASFSAHNQSRSNTDEITQEQMESDIDLFFGTGTSYYDTKSDILDANHWSYTSHYDNLNNQLDNALVTPEIEQFFAAFTSISVKDETITNTTPTLAQLSLLALEYLSNQYAEEGFFIMIEGSQIDKKSHENNLVATMDEVIAFDEAVEAVVNWSKNNQETLVVVTADHETGGLQGNVESSLELNDALFTTTSHTSANVPVIIYDRFNEFNLEAGQTISNTFVGVQLRSLLLNILIANLS